MNKTAKIFTYKLYLTLILLILLLLCSSSYAMAAAEAKITSHPAGNSMEVGVADFYLEVQANSPDGGELLYQWFVSSYSDMHDMKAVALPDDEKYGKTSTLIPPQELGTLYYCVEIVNYSNGRHSRPVLSNVATVTFSPFTLHVADIRDIDQPESTKKPDTTAERHSDDVLSSFYGYDITGIKWAPNDPNGWGYGNAPKTLEAFTERYCALTEILLSNPHIMGLCYTQLTDIEQEQNGLYYYNREPKFAPEIFAEILKQKAKIED